MSSLVHSPAEGLGPQEPGIRRPSSAAIKDLLRRLDIHDEYESKHFAMSTRSFLSITKQLSDPEICQLSNEQLDDHAREFLEARSTFGHCGNVSIGLKYWPSGEYQKKLTYALNREMIVTNVGLIMVRQRDYKRQALKASTKRPRPEVTDGSSDSEDEAPKGHPAALASGALLCEQGEENRNQRLSEDELPGSRTPGTAADSDQESFHSCDISEDEAYFASTRTDLCRHPAHYGWQAPAHILTKRARAVDRARAREKARAEADAARAAEEGRKGQHDVFPPHITSQWLKSDPVYLKPTVVDEKPLPIPTVHVGPVTPPQTPGTKRPTVRAASAEPPTKRPRHGAADEAAEQELFTAWEAGVRFSRLQTEALLAAIKKDGNKAVYSGNERKSLNCEHKVHALEDLMERMDAQKKRHRGCARDFASLWSTSTTREVDYRSSKTVSPAPGTCVL